MTQPEPEAAEPTPIPGPVFVYTEMTVTHPPVESMTEDEKRHLGLIP